MEVLHQFLKVQKLDFKELCGIPAPYFYNLVFMKYSSVNLEQPTQNKEPKYKQLSICIQYRGMYL